MGHDGSYRSGAVGGVVRSKTFKMAAAVADPHTAVQISGAGAGDRTQQHRRRQHELEHTGNNVSVICLTLLLPFFASATSL